MYSAVPLEGSEPRSPGTLELESASNLNSWSPNKQTNWNNESRLSGFEFSKCIYRGGSHPF